MNEESLITQVQRYPELFNPQNPFYKDIVRKEIAWRAISLEIECTVQDCKLKWKSLRDRLVKQKRRQNQPSGSGASAQREWRLWPLMHFLVPFIPNRSSVGNLEADQEEPTEGTQDEAQDTAQEPVERSSRPESRPRSRQRSRSRSPNKIVNEKLMEYLTAKPQTKSESELFLMSLVPQMERLNERNRSKAKMRFLQVLEDLETSEPQYSYPGLVHDPSNIEPNLFF
ncbi:unnamed protein product [Knipowitschia caucasica]